VNELERPLAEALQHTFQNGRLLAVALTHRSAAFEASSKKSKALEHNERMEFLGDSVLALVVSEALFARCPDAAEGVLTRMRAAIVNETRLAKTAARLGIGDALRLGRGEEQTGGRTKPSLLADTLEAVFAAVYLDAGMERAREVILAQLAETIDLVIRGADTHRDEKTLLQERVQALRNVTPTYEVVGMEGPDHERVWHVEVKAGDSLRARGQGRSKKAAEQDAAGHAIRLLDEPAPSVAPTPAEGSDG
jgi:ribonuclease-3